MTGSPVRRYRVARHVLKAPASSALQRDVAMAVAIATAMLTACAPRNIAPLLVPESSQSLGLVSPATAGVAQAWWTAFGDPQLDRIMADAAAANPSLEAAQAGVRAAQAAIGIEYSVLLPHVNGTEQGSYGRLSARQLTPPPFAGSDRWIGSAQTNLSWTVDFAGRQRALLNQASHNAEAAALDVGAAWLTITSAVAETYVNLTRAEMQAEVARQFVASRRKSLSLAQSCVRSGLASEFDLRVAETLVAEAEQAQTRAESERALMVHALAALAGRGADYYAGVTSSRLDLAATLPIPDALPANLLTRRPDLMAASARIVSAQAGRRVARADFLPALDLRAFVGVSAVGLRSLFTSAAATSGVGPSVSLPIVEGGRLRARLGQATAYVDVATAQYDAIAVVAVREAADALSNVESSAAEAAQQRKILSGYAETSRLARSRRESGLSAETDVLASNERLLQAQLSQTQFDAEATIRRIQLLVAIGGDFRPPTPVSAHAVRP